MSNKQERPAVIQIDMTPDGQFTQGFGGSGEAAPVASKLFRLAVIAGVLTMVAALVALTLWVALALIPVIIGVGVVSYLAIRFQMWRRGGSGGFPPRQS
jgi:hypothetical protein